MKTRKLFLFHPATHIKQKQQLLKSSVQMSIADSVIEIFLILTANSLQLKEYIQLQKKCNCINMHSSQLSTEKGEGDRLDRSLLYISYFILSIQN